MAKIRQDVFDPVICTASVYQNSYSLLGHFTNLGLVDTCLPDPSLHIVELMVSHAIMSRRRRGEVGMYLLLQILLRLYGYGGNGGVRGRCWRGCGHAGRGCDGGGENEVVNIHRIRVRSFV